MRNLTVGRMLRLLRLKKNLRQSDVADRATLSATTIARHEAGLVASLDSLQLHAAALGFRADVVLYGRGGEGSRLLDEEHAAIVEVLVRRSREIGRLIETELSFNEWGERGRVDLATFDADNRVLGVVEVKAELTDLQEMLGRLSVKERLAPRIVAGRGWQPNRTVITLAIAATAANRRIVADHPALFASFTKRWFKSTEWPVDHADGRTLLWIPARMAGRSQWRAGRRRVRAAKK